MSDQQPEEVSGVVTARLAADMQDELLAAGTELERLERLLSDAVDQLLDRFGRAHALSADISNSTNQPALAGELRAAMTALQFQDMASQLIAHSRRRLASVADCLGNAAIGGEEEEEEGCEVQWVSRACPVAQRAVDAGSVELF
jgi:hypothetical protein